ncbi:MAG TPA: hypothetical protein VN493_17285 [Thermoanaerobaculia bacterium]|nr:hypothetical protein [Thermoanaerobaculia bacterium]
MALRALLVLLCLLLPSFADAAHASGAAEILRRMLTRYEEMETYSSGVRTVHELTDSAGKVNRYETAGSVRLTKPAYYRITWVWQPSDGSPQEGDLWSSGQGPRLRLRDRYYKMPDDVMAFASATGVSQGAAHTIPSLFFPFLQGQRVLGNLADLRLLRSEEVDGEPCYVLAGTSPTSGEMVLWISEARLLLLRQSYSVRPSEISLPSPGDDEIADEIRRSGGEATEESIQAMKSVLEMARGLVKAGGWSSQITETYSAIRIDTELETRDFAVAIPEGAVLLDSPWADVADALPKVKLPVPAEQKP